MKKLKNLAVLGLLILVVPAYSQTADDNEKLSKADRKELKQLERDQEMNELKEVVNERSFLIDADFLLDRQSRQYMATANNFVSIEGDRVVMQTASPYGIGYNGIGGVTFVGRILDYKVNESKNGNNLFVTIQTSSVGYGNGTIFISIRGKENAVARFYGPWGRSLAFSGDVERHGGSFKYKGMSVPM
ncbi:MAG: DUF4251 domain-containing protein [Imperialibacter sp.]|uniref:DUF4251 domain-containing protein n=1 Tax=Imperialibacter sp. TaxID=2038411 RepID=UPI0032EA981B